MPRPRLSELGRNLFGRGGKDRRAGSTTPIPHEYRTINEVGSNTHFFKPPSRRSALALEKLTRDLLERIFSFVCPHAQDESYEKWEHSFNDGCMLCDLRDLSHCVQVNRSWRDAAVRVLYHSVRIEVVHYCVLEPVLAERRKKTSRFEKNGIPEDTARARLSLLRRTVRDDPTRIGVLVRFLKTPQMLRDACHVELAQTIAVLPNLKYVDLPQELFSDKPLYETLRLEVQTRCPHLGKATYEAGSEHSFATLKNGQIWSNLEVLELNNLKVDPHVLRDVLTSLQHLRALKVTETHTQTHKLSDEFFVADEDLRPLPALEELILKGTRSLTCAGLAEYLSFYETQESLKVLTLKDTGIQARDLQEVLALAPYLSTLAIQCSVSDVFPAGDQIQPLAHERLKTLRYEISSSSSAGPYITKGYYGYLANSILTAGLPKLQRLYVLNENFPEQLQSLPPPRSPGRAHASSTLGAPSLRVSPPSGGLLSPTSPTRQRIPQSRDSHRLSSNNPFVPAATGTKDRSPPTASTQTLEIFTKRDTSGKWNFARVDSFTASKTQATRRPSSIYGLTADVAGQGWDRGEARRSVMIGNGSGAFLPAPGGGGDSQSSPGVFSLGPVPGRKRPEGSRLRDEQDQVSWNRV